MRRVHLDTDIAGDPDDVCGLALLLALPDVQLTGVTTVTEQNGRRVGYTNEILRLAKRTDVRVVGGAVEGIDPLPMTPGIPDGPQFWPHPVMPRPNPPNDALELIDRSVEQGAVVVGIGPYTNLALYERKHPGKLAKSGLVLMGGYLGPLKRGLPPWGVKEDWNFFIDPAATAMVLARCNPLLVPLDVTLQVHLRRRDVPALRDSGPLGELIASQAEGHDAIYKNHELFQRYTALPNDLLNFHHDPLAAAVAIGWDKVVVEKLRLRLELRDRFPTLIRDSAAPALRVVTAVDGDAFSAYWLSAVTALSRRAA